MRSRRASIVVAGDGRGCVATGPGGCLVVVSEGGVLSTQTGCTLGANGWLELPRTPAPVTGRGAWLAARMSEGSELVFGYRRGKLLEVGRELLAAVGGSSEELSDYDLMCTMGRAGTLGVEPEVWLMTLGDGGDEPSEETELTQAQQWWSRAWSVVLSSGIPIPRVLASGPGRHRFAVSGPATLYRAAAAAVEGPGGERGGRWEGVPAAGTPRILFENRRVAAGQFDLVFDR